MTAQDVNAARALPDELASGAVIDYLAAHGLVAGHDAVTVEPLLDGVSSDVVAIHVDAADGPRDWVLKRALPQLRVARTWVAGPERAVTEARAMALAATLLPGTVPALVLVDPVNFVTVQQRAPGSLVNWRTSLLSDPGARDVETAQALGAALGTLHGRTAGRTDLARDFGDLTAFQELRIEPFHRTVATVLPEVAPLIETLAAELLDRPACLVHGDFSPKNVLADGRRVQILDWEVAHLGNPVFDLAFLLAHLVCKSVHRPNRAPRYAECAHVFLQHYAAETDPALRPDDRTLAAHVAALVLARTDGKSPAPYLTADETDTARRRALRWLGDPSVLTTDVWNELT